jgi:hypothetical protein
MDESSLVFHDCVNYGAHKRGTNRLPVTIREGHPLKRRIYLGVVKALESALLFH